MDPLVKETTLLDNSIKESVPALLFEHITQGSAIVAGGFIRSFFEKSTPRDIDVWFLDRAKFTSSVERLTRSGWLIAEENLNEDFYNIALKKGGLLSIDLVHHKHIGSFNDLRNSLFDFTITKAFFTENRLWHDEYFLRDVQRRRLTYLGSPFPTHSYQRMLKFVNKNGYSISEKEVRKIISDIQHEDKQIKHR